MNFDPRSTSINTEIGLFIRGEDLAEDILGLLEIVKREAAYRVRVDARGRIAWEPPPADMDKKAVASEPEASAWRRLLLQLAAPLGPVNAMGEHA